MKKLTCEMCGNTDLIKQDGVFVCQSCGTKYSVEEAKKMMVEGTVDVKGTVKVDDSEELNNLYVIARRARDENNANDAYKYYEMILLKEPTSWEATFFVPYFKSLLKFYNKGLYARSEAMSFMPPCIPTVMKLIKENYNDRKVQVKSVELVTKKCVELEKLYSSYVNRDEKKVYKHHLRELMYSIGDCIYEYFNEYSELHSCAIEVWNIALSNVPIIFNEEYEKIIKDHVSKLNDYGEYITYEDVLGHNINRKKTSGANGANISNNTSGGCYVATAVYGSYDCPQVWTLRRFRDDILAKTWYGRAFIYTYYAISPIIVKKFGHAEWFKKMWHGKLDRMVERLQKNGVKSTPYKDKKY